MTFERIVTIVSVIVAVASMLVVAVKGRVDARRDQRKLRLEERAQVNDDAETTLGLLREQNGLLRTQNADLSEAAKEREVVHERARKEWREREDKFERRIERLEDDYRTLVVTITTMGLCANAPKCKDYSPGDRRVKDAAAI